MTQGRIYRIAAGAIYPPIAGWLGFFLIANIVSREPSVYFEYDKFKMALVFLVVAYGYTIIPSTLCSLFLEFVIHHFVKSDIVAISIAGLLGAGTGYYIGTLWWQIGLGTGLLIGWHLRSNYKRSIHESHQRSAGESDDVDPLSSK